MSTPEPKLGEFALGVLRANEAAAKTPIIDDDGRAWTYSPDRDCWFSDANGALDWEDMRGCHPEVLAHWSTLADVAGGSQ